MVAWYWRRQTLRYIYLIRNELYINRYMVITDEFTNILLLAETYRKYYYYRRPIEDPLETYMYYQRPPHLIKDRHASSETHSKPDMPHRRPKNASEKYPIRHVGIWSGMLVSDQACRFPMGRSDQASQSHISDVGLQSDMSVSNGSPMRNVGLLGDRLARSESNMPLWIPTCLIRDRNAWSSMSDGSPLEISVSDEECRSPMRHVGLWWVSDDSCRSSMRHVVLQWGKLKQY